MIGLKDLSYRYGCTFYALRDINTNIPNGIHLLLGENGAGKTTLLKMMSGLLLPTIGGAFVDGQNVAERRPEVMQNVFFVPEDCLMPARTINEFARVHSRFYPGFNAEDFRQNLADFAMTGDEPLGSLSLGMRKRANLAYVLSLHCSITLLDEPANGLDINAKKILRQMIMRTCSDDQTIVISTHTVWDLEQLFDGVIVLRQGRLVLSKMVYELAERIAFVTSPNHYTGALYEEVSMAGYRSIVQRRPEMQETAVDFNLLYSSLMSKNAEIIINLINEPLNTENNATTC
jgi:ABC-2 type transport system ATP-binding protein